VALLLSRILTLVDFRARIGAEVKNFQPENIITDRKAIEVRFAFAWVRSGSAEEALRDAGIRPVPATANRWGFSVGAGMMAITYRDLEAVP